MKFERCNIEEKTGAKGPYLAVGLKLDGKWYNGLCSPDKRSEIESWKPGEIVNVITFQKEGNDGRVFDNWRFPKESDKMEQRLKDLEQWQELAKKWMEIAHKRITELEYWMKPVNERIEELENKVTNLIEDLPL